MIRSPESAPQATGLGLAPAVTHNILRISGTDLKRAKAVGVCCYLETTRKRATGQNLAPGEPV